MEEAIEILEKTGCSYILVVLDESGNKSDFNYKSEKDAIAIRNRIAEMKEDIEHFYKIIP